MVRRGSTVRVRQRACKIPAHGDFRSERLALRRTCGRYGAVYGAFAFARTALSIADGHAWVINDLSHSADEIACATTAVVKTLVFGTNASHTAKLTPKDVSIAPDGTAWIALQAF
jgi:hypothetical protein